MAISSDPYDRSLDSTLAALEAQKNKEIQTIILGFVPDFNQNRHIDALRRARLAGRLCLAIGAGISIPYRLPNWEDLVVQLHNKYLPVKDSPYIKSLCQRFDVSLISLTRFIAAHSVNPTAFLHTLHQALYQNHDPAYNEANLASIAAVVADTAARVPSASTLTYNIDDLLERCLDRHHAGLAYRCIFTAETHVEPLPGLRIIHPHGFLPFKPKTLAPYIRIVLSESAYHAHYLHHFHWANMAQLEAFTQKICIFIGLSFSDPNLRRLLDFSKTVAGRQYNHIVVKRAEADNHYNYFFQKDMEILGADVLWIRDYGEIAMILEEVMK